MKNFIISPLDKKLIVSFTNRQITLPQDIQDKIGAYWNDLIKSGKKYRRGEVFTVTEKKETKDTIEVLVEKTDYAHYLYCQNVDDLGEYGVHIIHTAVLVETLDGKTIFGRMGEQTSRAGVHQLCGGGIDNDDLTGNVFDFEHNIKKELEEELGINVGDKQRIRTFAPAYFKEGGPTNKMTVVYRVKLNETGDEFSKKYDKFVAHLQENGEQPEFGKIIILDKNKEIIISFFAQENIKFDGYMGPLFEYLMDHEF